MYDELMLAMADSCIPFFTPREMLVMPANCTPLKGERLTLLNMESCTPRMLLARLLMPATCKPYIDRPVNEVRALTCNPLRLSVLPSRPMFSHERLLSPSTTLPEVRARS